MTRKRTPKQGIGKRLEDLRLSKGLTQRELAEALHINRSTLNMWERGERELICTDAAQIADYFNITADELIRGVKAQNTEIHAATGLSDGAIETLRAFSAGKPLQMAGVNKVLASSRFLGALGAFMDVPIKERGFYDSATYNPSDDFIDARHSPDSYAAYLSLRLLFTLNAIRTGDTATLQAYRPAVVAYQKTLEQMHAEGRIEYGEETRE